MSVRWKQFTRNNGERVLYRVDEVVVRQRTAYQLAEVIETPNYGRCFYLDHKVQSAALDEFIYHESLVHPALVTHPAPRRVFIAGGGEGATARHALAHSTVERVVMVDIDAEVVAFCRKYLTDWHQGAFDNPRLTLLHADARRYLAETDETFDTILIDIPDPLPGSPARLLFTSEFYQLAASRLSDQGTLAVQAESGNLSVLQQHVSIIKTLETAFPAVRSYQANVPSYADAWAFATSLSPLHGVSTAVPPYFKAAWPETAWTTTGWTKSPTPSPGFRSSRPGFSGAPSPANVKYRSAG